MARTLRQAIAHAVKTSRLDYEPPTPRFVVHRGPRPRIILDVHRQPPADDQHCPTAGTLTVDQAGRSANLHACRRKFWSPAEAAGFVEQLSGLGHLTITGHTGVACDGTRRSLNQRWREIDLANSGLLPDNITDLLLRP